MTTINKILAYFDSLLVPEIYSDYCFNGLQIESSNTEVRKVSFAVDAGESILDKAIAANSDLLVVHHGVFWNNIDKITGNLSKKLKKVFSANLNLYVSHLPLDANKEVGNNYEFGRFLNLSDLSPFAKYKDFFIGTEGTLPKPVNIEELVQKITTLIGYTNHLLLPFGKKEIQKVGIASGSGGNYIPEAKLRGLDLLISGEAKHEHYHLSKEYEINSLFVGHYASETFGVLALKRKIEENFKDIETLFIDEPTGI